MISSTSCGSFVAYTASESPTSKLNPHPVRSSSKWRVSFADSGPLRRRLTTRRAGKGFARVYRGGAAAAAAVAVASVMASLVAAISGPRKYSSVISDCERRANFHRALGGGGFLGSLRLFAQFVRHKSSKLRVRRRKIGSDVGPGATSRY